MVEKYDYWLKSCHGKLCYVIKQIYTIKEFSKQVILIHSRDDLADPELLPSVRKEARQVLLEKGVELFLGISS